MEQAGALYTQLGPDRFHSTNLTAGPWSPDAQHGSPIAALLVHCMERADAVAPLPVARVTIELLRPVPVAELVVHARVRRPGRLVRLLEAEALHEGTQVALGTAWVIAGDAPVRSDDAAPLRSPRPTGRGIEMPQLRDRGFHVAAVEIDFVAGGFDQPGPGTAWIRLRVPVVAGHRVTPAQRAVVAADFGNGISSVVDAAATTFINPDLTVYLSRAPQGEWVAVDSVTRSGGEGFGYAESVLSDTGGIVGRSAQSLLFQTRR